ncbi:MAG TPA: hypothetical protein VM536_02220, partial [Chloroflexia bacterium]|nr:hypothetical protein [Chloroflexia bacterium]
MTDRREQGRASAGGRGVSAAISGYLLVLVAISVQQTWWPASAGLPALGEVFAPYLFAPLLLALPWAPRRRSVALALGAGLAVFLLRFPPHLPVA